MVDSHTVYLFIYLINNNTCIIVKIVVYKNHTNLRLRKAEVEYT